MRLTKRDVDIQKTIYEFQSMTVTKIGRLYGINEKTCQKILRRLCKAGYLRKMPIPSQSNGRSPNLFYLGTKGAELLGVSPSRPRLNYEHTHMQRNVSVYIDIILSFKSTEIDCSVFSEHLIRTQRQEIIPDGVVMLSRDSKAILLMLECDYGTEILRSKSGNHSDLENKLHNYLNLYESNNLGFYENHYSHKFNRFRVLLICSDSNRLNSISHLLTEKRFHFIWLATLSDLSKQTIAGNIWYVPSLGKHNLSII